MSLPVEWNVFRTDVNQKTIKSFNVFKHGRFMMDLASEIKRNKNQPSALEMKLRFLVRYYYWSKCEWEIWITDWITASEERGIKVDVFDQLDMNWDKFFDYVWEHRSEIQKIGEEWKRRWG